MGHDITLTLRLVFGILSSFFLNSCGDTIFDYEYTYSFTYDNQTEYPIEIRNWFNDVEYLYTLSPSDQINFKDISPSIGGDGSCYINDAEVERNDSIGCTSFPIFADSVKVTFDGSRTYWLSRRDDVEVNILKQTNYDSTKEGKSDFYYYSFTNDDYQYSD